MSKTLEELRAENAAAEAAANPAPQADEPEAEEVAAAGTITDDDLAEGGEGGEGQQAEPEDWMKGDDQESHGAEKKFSDGDIGIIKAKVRAKVERQKQTELDELRAQLRELQSARAPQSQPASPKPKREDFWEHEDPDEAYSEALVDWKLNTAVAQKREETAQQEAQRRQIEERVQVGTKVDQHYERAAKLAAASGISAELYKSADQKVRDAIEDVFPGGGGEVITDLLIASLGEGSEMVFYKLGRSQAHLSELVTKLKQNPKGNDAFVYLGRLSAELTVPARKRSNTPAPATNVQGDANATDLSRTLLRRYQEAHKRGDTQAAFEIRSEAKGKQINVKSW